MIIGAIFILLAWFVEMPLWLSVIITIAGAVKAVASLIRLGMELKN